MPKQKKYRCLPIGGGCQAASHEDGESVEHGINGCETGECRLTREVEIDGSSIRVTQELYSTFKRPLWAEHKRKEREGRCRDELGRVCDKPCKECDRQREPNVISLDKLMEYGFDAADAEDIAAEVVERLLADELYRAVSELDPLSRRIVELFADGMSERKIARMVGLSQKGVNKRKRSAFSWLKERLDGFR
jgi:DNA-directed RNA polymerase specialized sigma subunit